MTIPEYKKINDLLHSAYKEIENEAIRSGINLMSPEYDTIVQATKEKILAGAGISVSEFNDREEYLDSISPETVMESVRVLSDKIDSVESKIPVIPPPQEIPKPTFAELSDKPEIITKEQVLKIVKNNIPVPREQRPLIQVSRPINQTIVQREEYDASPILAEIDKVKKVIDNLPRPDIEGLRKEFTKESQDLKEAIQITNAKQEEMPDFRKLAMGMQGEIDALKSGKGDVKSIIAGANISVSPANGQGDVTITNTLTAPQPFVTQDTEANILASTPTKGLAAWATDLGQVMIADGSNWWVNSSYLDLVSANPDLGFSQISNRQGYGSYYISDKIISNSAFGGNANSVNGGFKYIAVNNSGVPGFQGYLGAWADFVVGFKFREVNGVLQTLPAGGSYWLIASSGDSVELSLNQLPTVQGGVADMGPFAVPQVIDGGVAVM